MVTKEKYYYPKSFIPLETSDLAVLVKRPNQFLHFDDYYWVLGKDDASDDTLLRKSVDGLLWTTEQTIPGFSYLGSVLNPGENAVLRMEGANMVLTYSALSVGVIYFKVKTYTDNSTSTEISSSWDASTHSTYYIWDYFKIGTTVYVVTNELSAEAAFEIWKMVDTAAAVTQGTQSIFGFYYGRGDVSNNVYYCGVNTVDVTLTYYNTIFSYDSTTITEEISFEWGDVGSGSACISPTIEIKHTTLLFINSKTFFIAIEDFTEFSADKARLSTYTSLTSAQIVVDKSDGENVIGIFGEYGTSYQYWRIGKTGNIYKSQNIPISGAIPNTNFGIGDLIGFVDDQLLLRCISLVGQILELSVSGGDFVATYSDFAPQNVRFGSQLLMGNRMFFNIDEDDVYSISNGEYLEIHETVEAEFEDDFEDDTIDAVPNVLNWDTIDNFDVVQGLLVKNFRGYKCVGFLSIGDLFPANQDSYIRLQDKLTSPLICGSVKFKFQCDRFNIVDSPAMYFYINDVTSNTPIKMRFSNTISGMLQIRDYAHVYIDVIQFAHDIWYDFQIIFDCEKGYFELWVDNVFIIKMVMSYAATGLDDFIMGAIDWNGSGYMNMYMTNFWIGELPEVMDGAYDLAKSEPGSGIYKFIHGVEKDLEKSINIISSNKSYEKLNDIIDNYCDFIEGTIADDSFVSWYYAADDRKIKDYIMDIMEHELRLFMISRSKDATFISDPIAGAAILSLNNTNMQNPQFHLFRRRIRPNRQNPSLDHRLSNLFQRHLCVLYNLH